MCIVTTHACRVSLESWDRVLNWQTFFISKVVFASFSTLESFPKYFFCRWNRIPTYLLLPRNYMFLPIPWSHMLVNCWGRTFCKKFVFFDFRRLTSGYRRWEWFWHLGTESYPGIPKLTSTKTSILNYKEKIVKSIKIAILSCPLGKLKPFSTVVYHYIFLTFSIT